MEIRPTRVTWSGRPHSGAAALWVVLLWAAFTVAAVVSSVLVLRRPPDDRLSDLHIYYGAAEAVRAGDALYGFVAENGGPFTYPPFAAVLFVILTWIPELTLRIIWLAATTAAVAGLGVTMARLLPGRSVLLAPGVAITVLVTASAQSNLRFGQVSVFLVLLALIDAAGLTPVRYRGVLIGLAAAIKLTPLLFVLFFVASGQTRPAVRAIAAFLVCGVLGAAVLPADSWTYWSGTFLHTSRIGDLTSTGNQSINGLLLRAGVPEGVLTPLWLVLATVVCLAALWHARRAQLAGEPLRAAVVIGCATVAASPVSWTHHQVWLALAAIVLLLAPGGRAARIAGGVLLATAVVSFGAMASGAGAYPLVRFLGENARALGAVAVCLAGLGVLSVRPAPSSPVPETR
jgi:alpha-1,2-mannosyltransferase